MKALSSVPNPYSCLGDILPIGEDKTGASYLPCDTCEEQPTHFMIYGQNTYDNKLSIYS